MGSGPSKFDDEPATILISGGGIVGLTLAMSLKKQLNIRAEVYEKASTFATEAGTLLRIIRCMCVVTAMLCILCGCLFLAAIYNRFCVCLSVHFELSLPLPDCVFSPSLCVGFILIVAPRYNKKTGAGLGMYPNGLRVLRDISPELLQAVRDAGYPYQTRRWERHDGTNIMDADETLLAGNQQELAPIGIRRSKLQKVLYHYARFQGIRVHFRKPLDHAVERPDGLVEVTFGVGPND